MQCPQCLTNTKVKSTNKDAYHGVQRYRKCPKCDYGFITMEKIQALTNSTAFRDENFTVTTNVGHVTTDIGHVTTDIGHVTT